MSDRVLPFMLMISIYATMSEETEESCDTQCANHCADEVLHILPSQSLFSAPSQSVFTDEALPLSSARPRPLPTKTPLADAHACHPTSISRTLFNKALLLWLSGRSLSLFVARNALRFKNQNDRVCHLARRLTLFNAERTLRLRSKLPAPPPKNATPQSHERTTTCTIPHKRHARTPCAKAMRWHARLLSPAHARALAPLAHAPLPSHTQRARRAVRATRVPKSRQPPPPPPQAESDGLRFPIAEHVGGRGSAPDGQLVVVVGGRNAKDSVFCDFSPPPPPKKNKKSGNETRHDRGNALRWTAVAQRPAPTPFSLTSAWEPAGCQKVCLRGSKGSLWCRQCVGACVCARSGIEGVAGEIQSRFL